MSFWKKKKSRQTEIDAIFGKMAAAVFPDGEAQIALEAQTVVSLLDGSVSQEEARDIWVHAKGRALLAVQSASDGEEALKKCSESVLIRSSGKLNRDMAEKVALYAFQRLVAQQDESPAQRRMATWEEMTQEEALVIARIAAYRIARHRGRVDAEVHELYNLDPQVFILTYVKQLLIGDENHPQKKVETRSEALELTLEMASKLVLSHYAQTGDIGSLPSAQEIDRLAKRELELTLQLVRNKEGVERYSDYDVSEARAAHELHIPFEVALRLGETGILRDPPEPTAARRKVFEDVLGQLEGD
ncbi:MAG: hypothetical protein OXG29_04840 [Gammaproteobacteria bacterium]|nr:hypothetical protein [Gammaproteobacteria bacterium]